MTTVRDSIDAEIDANVERMTSWLNAIERAPGVNHQQYLKATDYFLMGFAQLRAAIGPRKPRIPDLPPAPYILELPSEPPPGVCDIGMVRTEGGRPVAYRLRKALADEYGPVVLQGLYRWWQGSDSGETWRDIPTAEPEN